jgi:hypothetical protein
VAAHARLLPGSGRVYQFWNGGEHFAPDTAGPVTFTAVLDPESLPVTDPARQLTVALVFIGANDHIYWAAKLAG